MNLFAKNIEPLKPILKQKNPNALKAQLFFEALANVTIGSSLYPNPELL